MGMNEYAVWDRSEHDWLHMKRDKIKNIIKPGMEFTIQNRAGCFLPSDRLLGQSAENSFLGKIQNVLKRYGKIYYTLLYWFAPVLSSYAYCKGLKKLLASYGGEDVIINLASRLCVIAKK